MNRDDVLAVLKERRTELEAMKVTSAALFGSVARNEAGPESDVDILIDAGRGMTLFDIVRIQSALQNWIGRKIDLATRKGLHPALRENILKEAVNAWP